MFAIHPQVPQVHGVVIEFFLAGGWCIWQEEWCAQGDMYNVVGVVKSVFTAPSRTLLAMRGGSRIKGAPRSGTFIVDPLTLRTAR
jgi:hypothetical protein